ncbi:MAG: PEP-CTERM sorting domain-containing protein [Rhizobacter sp.]|jgi:hypothetical protein
MGKFILRRVVIAAALALGAPLASATVLTFDDLGADGLVPSNYGGLDWSSSTWFSFGGDQAPFSAHSGSYRATLGWDGSTDTSAIGFATANTFAGAWFAGYEGVSVTFDLFFQGTQVASSAALAVSGTSSFLSSGYAGLVDRVLVRSNDPANFVMDDFTFGSPVPEPASTAMLLAGLGLVAVAARRRRT